MLALFEDKSQSTFTPCSSGALGRKPTPYLIMPLESTMICLDNSEWMRNGDYPPNRMEAQHDAANVLCGSKTNSNPESTVGILTMAGKSVQCLASPTEDIGKLLGVIHNVSISGSIRFVNAIQVAQLALKHRRNKKGGQRIIVFVGSPIKDDEKPIVKIGKLLKKNNVAVDVVSFGDAAENQAKLTAFVDAVNSNNNSNLVTIPLRMHPADVILSSPIVQSGDSHGNSASDNMTGGGDNFTEYGGIDPNMDPELALALRVSMEEERARQEAASKKDAEDNANSSISTNFAESKSTQESVDAEAASRAAEEEEQLLSKALAMSMNTESTSGDSDEEKAIQAALQMAMQQPENKGSSSTAAASKDGNTSAAPPPAPVASSAFLDPSFVNSLLSELPGVDISDPKIKAAMSKIAAQSSGKKDEAKKDDAKKDDSKKQ